MAHSHDHDHSHQHPHKVLISAIVLIFLFAAIELFGGWWSRSLILLSDAGHMFSDGIALIIAAFASWIALRPPSQKHSYGLGRAEVVAAGLSSLLMLVIALAVIIEAVHRLHRPQPVLGGVVIFFATAGLITNVIVAWLLARGERTLNIRAALLHVMSDILGSISALIAGTVIYFTHWVLIDPILSILIGILILISSLSLIRESLLVLMEGVPGHLELKKVSQALHQVEGIKAIHDLHIWTLSSGKVALSAHINVHDFDSWQIILPRLQRLLIEQFKIDHITLQPELEIVDCQPCPEIGNPL